MFRVFFIILQTNAHIELFLQTFFKRSWNQICCQCLYCDRMTLPEMLSNKFINFESKFKFVYLVTLAHF